MGIQGLLPFLKKIHESVNVSQFAGCTVAIDAYCWLHKGAFSCAEKLAMGEKTDQYVYYCMKYINYLLAQNIKPIMVLDGCHLPSKKNVEKTRREKREQSRKKAAQFLREGRRAEAHECFQRSIDISPEMALELMNACRDRGVDCIVAPYEADAQLAYLNMSGIAQIVITEDSDLLLFGCDKVIFKMDHSGNGMLIKQSRLNEVMDIQGPHYTFDKFRYMCILSGCDYLPSLPGIGLVKANKVFKVARQADLEQLLKKLSTYLKMNVTVSQEYVDGFIAADNTFLYQLSYDPIQRKLVPLNPYPPDRNPEDMTYAGAYMPREKASQIALGNINIYTGQKFAHFDPVTFVPKYSKKKPPDQLYLLSMWNKNYRPRPRGPLQEAQLSDRPVLKGREVSIEARFKKSPKKRVREAEDGDDVKSNLELSSLYGDSPANKRVRRDNIDEGLQRFLFAPHQDMAASQSDSDDEPAPTPTGLTRSPRFFNSLSRAQPAVVKAEEGADTGDPDSHVEGRPGTDDSEQCLKSPPSRNVFAQKSPAKRYRFDLNAPKLVKSRFFANEPKKEVLRASKSDTAMSQPVPQHLPQAATVPGYTSVHSNTANMTAGDPSVDDTSSLTCDTVKGKLTEYDGKQFPFSKLGTKDSQECSPSPQSAFVWSKFKFSRNSSDSQSTPPSRNKRVNSKFKKVVSESNLTKFLTSKSDNVPLTSQVCKQSETTSADDCDLESCSNSTPAKCLESETESSQDTQELPSTLDTVGSSLPYSIDSMCVSDLDSESQSHSPNDAAEVLCTVMETSSEKAVSNYFRPKSITDKSTGQAPLEECVNASAVTNNSTPVSDCVTGQSHEAMETELSPCTGSTSEPVDVVCLIDSDDEDTAAQKSVDVGNMSIPKPTARSVCRVSGLSRRSKKPGKSKVLDNKQHSLKDMFSKFAHSNRDGSGIQNSGPEDVIDLAFTPEGSGTLLHSKTAAQRNILPS